MSLSIIYVILASACCCLIIVSSSSSSSSSEPKDDTKNFSKYVPGCRSKSSEFNECLRKSLQHAIQVSHKGIPEFDIEDLDPFAYPDFSIRNPLGLRYKLTNTTQFGFTTFVLQRVRADVDNYYFEVQMKAPLIVLLGNYEMSGKLIALPLEANGRCNLTSIGLQYLFKIQGELNTSSAVDEQYMKVKQVTSTINHDKIISYLEKPFKNNPALNDVVNNLLNQNWKDLFLASKSDFEQIVSKIMYHNLQKYFSNVPYKLIFPD